MDNLKLLGDEQVWRLFREGNRWAFEEIYSRYHPVLSAYGMRLTGDADMVADAVQDLFVKLIRNCSSLKQTDSVKYYLQSPSRPAMLFLHTIRTLPNPLSMIRMTKR